jgi:hypothetical protein
MIPQAIIPAYGGGGTRDDSWRLRGLLCGDTPLRVTEQRICGAEAVRQAVILILNTERCRYPIYSWDHGVETDDLFGQPVSFIKPELERRVRQALMRDDRVTGVGGFVFEGDKKKLRCVFTVNTIFGDLEGVRFNAANL